MLKVDLRNVLKYWTLWVHGLSGPSDVAPLSPPPFPPPFSPFFLRFSPGEQPKGCVNEESLELPYFAHDRISPLF